MRAAVNGSFLPAIENEVLNHWKVILLFFLAFALVHMPTPIHRETAPGVQPDFQNEKIETPPIDLEKYEKLLRVAEETLNGGMTPVLQLKKYDLHSPMRGK